MTGAADPAARDDGDRDGTEARADTLRDVLARADAAGLTIATAESCTGGLVAALMTGIEGQSHAFDRGFIAYSNAAKRDMLGVPDALIDQFGAVSREVAVAMAEGAVTHAKAGLAVAITGYAGPSSEDGAEEGLVHLAAVREGRPVRHRCVHLGTIGRDAVRARCAELAVELLAEAMDG